MQARLVQDMQKLSPDHFDWATSIVLGRYPGAVQVPHLTQHDPDGMLAPELYDCASRGC